MITGVTFSTAPLTLGEERTIESSRETPVSVEIECFTEPPTPAELQPCSACGTFNIIKGTLFKFAAPREVFAKRTGYLRIVLKDGSEERTSNIEVINNETLTDEDKKAIEFVQDQLKTGLASVDQRLDELNRELKQRESVGLVLKVGTLVIGIIVASGLLPHAAVQGLGVLVLIIVGIEQTYGNLDKLKMFTAARNAYSRIRREVQAIHNDQLAMVIRDKARRQMDAANRLIELNRRLMKLLADTQQAVETAIEQKQLAMIDRLTLTDQAKQITSGTQAGAPSAG